MLRHRTLLSLIHEIHSWLLLVAALIRTIPIFSLIWTCPWMSSKRSRLNLLLSRGVKEECKQFIVSSRHIANELFLKLLFRPKIWTWIHFLKFLWKEVAGSILLSCCIIPWWLCHWIDCKYYFIKKNNSTIGSPQSNKL